MAGSHLLSTLDVPWDILDECAGLALDIGGSVIKITYIDKDDWVEPAKRVKGSKGKVRFSSFSRENLDEALKFIKTQVHILRKLPEEEVDIYTTGIGGAQFAQQIRKQLNVRSHNLAELDCFVQAFFKLLTQNTNSRKQIVHEPYKPAIENAKKQLQEIKAMIEKIDDLTAMGMTQGEGFEYRYQDDPKIRSDQPMANNKDIFPCLLIMLGSGCGSMLVQEDGSFIAVDGSNRGGRTFLGLGAMVTGVKTYDELMALCSKGQTRQISTTTRHMAEGIEGGDQDMYSSMTELANEFTIYCFGQTVGKNRESMKKEDLARGLLNTLILDMVHVNHLLAQVCKVKHVFFCGSFVQHHLVREEIAVEWLRRDTALSTTNPVMHGKQVDFYFLKQGSHLGSLGAFLNSKFKFLKPPPGPTESPAASQPSTEQVSTKKKQELSYKSSLGM